MRLFLVTLTGYGLRLRKEGGLPIDVGFVKNEVVTAKSEAEGSARAIEQVRAKLQTKADEGGLVLDKLDIRVDEVVPTRQFWKLVRQEGFIFFPREGVDVNEPTLH